MTDAKLVLAREICAKVAKELGLASDEGVYRRGGYDGDPEMLFAIEALNDRTGDLPESKLLDTDDMLARSNRIACVKLALDLANVRGATFIEPSRIVEWADEFLPFVQGGKA